MRFRPIPTASPAAIVSQSAKRCSISPASPYGWRFMSICCWSSVSSRSPFKRCRTAAIRCRPCWRTIGMGALAGVVLSAVGLIVVAAAMSGVALRDVDRTMVASVATDTATGIATKVRITALLMVAGLAALSDGVRLARLAMMMCGGIVVLSLTWLAHGAADGGSRGIIHLGGCHPSARGRYLARGVGGPIADVAPPGRALRRRSCATIARGARGLRDGRDDHRWTDRRDGHGQSLVFCRSRQFLVCRRERLRTVIVSQIGSVCDDACTGGR
jgi:hypothetical protein